MNTEHPLLPAPLKSFGGALADHVGLELGQPGEEDDHQSPDGAVHVDDLAAEELDHDHPHTPAGEPLQRVEDVLGSPAQPVQFGGDQNVTGLRVQQQPAALRPIPKVRAPAGRARGSPRMTGSGSCTAAQCSRTILAWTSGDACCFRVLARVMP